MLKRLLSFCVAIVLILGILLAVVADVNHGHGPHHEGEGHGEESHETEGHGEDESEEGHEGEEESHESEEHN